MSANLTSPEAFALLVREQQSLVFRTLTRLTGSGPHVEDLAQEAFLRLYRALPHFRGDATVSTYLYRIVVNLAQDEWKRRRKERTYIAAATPDADEADDEQTSWLENLAGDPLGTAHARSPEQHLADAEIEAAVDAALHTLPEVERAVLILYYQEECSYGGISLALGLPINTVRTHLHRGRKRLGEAVRGQLASRSDISQHPTQNAPRDLQTKAALAGKP